VEGKLEFVCSHTFGLVANRLLVSFQSSSLGLEPCGTNESVPHEWHNEPRSCASFASQYLTFLIGPLTVAKLLANMRLCPPSSFRNFRNVAPLSRSHAQTCLASLAQRSRHWRGLSSPAASLSLKGGATSHRQAMYIIVIARGLQHFHPDLETGNWCMSDVGCGPYTTAGMRRIVCREAKCSNIKSKCCIIPLKVIHFLLPFVFILKIQDYRQHEGHGRTHCFCRCCVSNHRAQGTPGWTQR
jgi:hypothetical protein